MGQVASDVTGVVEARLVRRLYFDGKNEFSRPEGVGGPSEDSLGVASFQSAGHRPSARRNWYDEEYVHIIHHTKGADDAIH